MVVRMVEAGFLGVAVDEGVAEISDMAEETAAVSRLSTSK
jgi:hypothetical protein